MIQIKCQCGSCNEWAVIELQGVLEIPDRQVPQHQLSIGTFCGKQKGTATLVVGIHKLEGKQVDLKKPLAILKKRTSAEAAGGSMEKGNPDSDVDGTPRKRQRSSSDAADAVQWELENGDKGSCVYDLVGVARSKFLFKTRPRPIISKPQS
mmetsp:Transcript_9352/g.34309  ORF Transcript_9352/g.34309 Transcript_9352/m.34309 type:complete len:151 (+) Transcript_9352:196-648(+)